VVLGLLPYDRAKNVDARAAKSQARSATEPKRGTWILVSGQTGSSIEQIMRIDRVVAKLRLNRRMLMDSSLAIILVFPQISDAWPDWDCR
jgi:hypothetical protein